MKIKLLVAASILAFTANVYAMPQKPAKCPSAGAIHDVGLTSDIVEQDNDGQWLVAMISSEYDTPGVKWSFVVGKIDATDKDDAFEKAKSSLDTLKFRQGPIAIQQISRWGCAYSTDQRYVAIAVTPDLSGGMLQSVTHNLI